MLYKKGDRITRQIIIGKPERMTGTVQEAYRGKPSNTAIGPPMYSVQWDGHDHIEMGYLEVSLERADPVAPTATVK